MAEVQELGERISEIKKLLVGVEMAVTVSIKVGEVEDAVLAKLHRLLGKVGLRMG